MSNKIKGKTVIRYCAKCKKETKHQYVYADYVEVECPCEICGTE